MRTVCYGRYGECVTIRVAVVAEYRHRNRGVYRRRDGVGRRDRWLVGNRDGDACRGSTAQTIGDGVGERVVASEGCVRCINRLTANNGDRAVRAVRDRRNGQWVPVRVRIVRKHVDRDGSIAWGRGDIVGGNWSDVQHRYRHGRGRNSTVAVRDRVREGVDSVKGRVRCVDRFATDDRNRSVASVCDGGDRQHIGIGIAVVGEHADRDRRVPSG